MSYIDWGIIIIYLLGLITLGWYLGKKQSNLKDYFLASKSLPWWAVGFSTMATQLGAISFISAPAFVGLRKGGGLIWLGYEFAVPLAMIILIWKVIPLFHKLGYISIYEYLEDRFDGKTRKFVSIVFLVSRALATGVAIYAIAIIISVILNISIFITIVIIGIVSILYDYMGGIKAVVYSDVIQMIMILAGIVICFVYGLSYIGGWDSIGKVISQSRFESVRFSDFGVRGGSDFGFLPLLLGGFFLYTSYYGFDQSQVQRELSAKSLLSSRGSLIFNAFARYPVVLLYCILGLIIGTFAMSNSEFMSMIPESRIDYMIPVFIVKYLPAGIRGLIVVSILAASMSSLDSALNSLSASTVEDILKPTVLRNSSESSIFRASKLATLCWGVFCTAFAFLAGRISPTVIESINMIGSVFYGPIAAVFILGIFVKTSRSRDVIAGGLAGVLTNLFLAMGIVKISWLWWNVVGFTVSFLLGAGISLFNKKVGVDINFKEMHNTGKLSNSWLFVFALLIIYVAAIIIITVNIKSFF